MRRKDCAAIAVDMPIGLSSGDPRQADVLARRLIGPRSSSVFPSPVRAVLSAGSHAEASLISSMTHRDGKKISRQTFFLLPKIREVDDEMSPSLQARVVESHPEVCFWALNKEVPLAWSKRTPEGLADRRRLLGGVYADSIAEVTPPRGSAWDDLHDACVLAWTASRLATGKAQRLPSEPEYDGRGLRMEIVY
jgi:predicted RNase H-like nuclease